ncbi:GNAT family N-acetyltransferase [Nocardiopsis sp. RSe5-2]|uniref:GNAT family N-acetyltransferase n=1 Tax=Nocardiopsis endophytica TaxID=3018445 RepID=A0ABT4U6Y3_9ACTN|nr:GNAT family N-acetyltransferase [Nocardiopsis endophytica]MDA2812718.1 GNAT family N-acetyltransferase [Nocardiopsis endophytica]
MSPPPAIPVRHARPDDAELIEEIRVAGWKAAYRGLMPDEFLDALTPDHGRRAAQLDDPMGTDLVADVDGRVTGWLSYGPARDGDAPPGANEVYACYVAPEAWRGGVGRALLETALAHLDGDPALLWVLKGNRRAIGFYAAFGFHPDGAERALERRGAADGTAGQGILEVRCRREPEGRVR